MPLINEKGVSVQEAYMEIGGFGIQKRSLPFNGIYRVNIGLWIRPVHHNHAVLFGNSIEI
jgi:hypothetical protein